MSSHGLASPLTRRLQRLARRVRWQNAVRAGCWGMTIGAVVAAFLIGTETVVGDTLRPLAVLAFSSITLAWIIAGLIRDPDLPALARTVDERAGLKDRTISALAFARKKQRTPCEELELADAVTALEQVVARQVLPFRLPRIAPLSFAATVAFLTLLSLSSRTEQASAKSEPPPPEVIRAAADVHTELHKLWRAAREYRERELEELIDELRARVDRLQRPGVDLRTALATLSELQQALAKQRARYVQKLAEPVLAELAEAVGDMPQFQAAAAALKNKDYERAAREFDKQTQPPQHGRRQLAKRLRRVASSAAEQGAVDLEGALTELSESLLDTASTDNEAFCSACKRLGKALRRRAALSRLCSALSAAQRAIGLCKSNCSGKGGGGQTQRGGKSDRPSSSWGRGVAGNTLGDPTALDAAKQLELLTGMQAEGPSQRELTSSPEGRQKATRSYGEVYEQYLRLSQEVLESEPIPLGQRELIRRYFELIRPPAPASQPRD